MPGLRLHLERLPKETYELGVQLKAELDKCTDVQGSYRNKLQKFMMLNDIWHIEELDYYWREEYEEYLKGEVTPASFAVYLKGFDRVKRHGMKKHPRITVAGKGQMPPYENELLFLPYHPYEWIAERFDKATQKKDLVWDFSLSAPEAMKRQVHFILHYMIEHIQKVETIRISLVGLRKLYQVCAEDGVEDIQTLEMEQLQKYYDSMTSAWEANAASGVLERCRKILFMESDKISWHANVWYMERFHFQPEREDKSNPVVSMSFLEVPHKGNRELLKKYMQYGLGLTNLSISVLRGELIYTRNFLREIEQRNEDICSITSEQMDQYFRTEQERPVQPETYNKKILVIQRFFDFLKIRQYIAEVPFRVERYLKKTFSVHHNRSVEQDAVNEIFEKLYTFPEVIRLMFLHLWGIGLRISEVCTLKGNAYYIQGKDAWIQVYQVKMRSYKRIPIPDALYKVMQVYLRKYQIQADEYVFKNSKGGPYRSGTFRKHMLEACAENGIQNGTYLFQSHDYRHTIATYFYDTGVSLQSIRDFLGHDYEEMTQQYVDYMPKKIDEANEQLFSQHSLAACLKKGVK